MASQFWVSQLQPYPVASGAAYNTSIALTDVSPAPQIVIPGGTFQPGQIYRVAASGTFSNTLTPTLLLGVYIGGVAGAGFSGGAITTITAATNWQWHMEINFQVRTIGTTGTFMPLNGKLRMPASATSFQTMYCVPSTAPATVTRDTTAAQAITIGAQWGASAAANTLTCLGVTVEQMN